MEKIKVTIDGMMCGMCESHICDEIRKQFAVKKVKASHRKGEAVILTDTDIPEEELSKVIQLTGYRVLAVDKETVKQHKWFQM